MSKFYPVSVVIVLLVLGFAVVVNGVSLTLYMNVPSLIFVVVLTTGLLFGSFSPREMAGAFRAAYSGSRPDDLKMAITFFTAMHRYLLWSGLLAMLTGVIVLLATLGDNSAVGFGAALALITVMYGVVLSLAIALPFRHAAEKRLAETEAI